MVAAAPDWPRLDRSAKTGDAAVELLQSCFPCHGGVAKLAGMDAEFTAIAAVDMVEQYPGTGSTDFRAISFAFSAVDCQNISTGELERELALMEACWAFFDDVRVHVPAGMQEGPRGGGCDWDQIVRHTLVNEQDCARKVGVQSPESSLLTDEGLKARRDAHPNAQFGRSTLRAKWPKPSRSGT